ncbi:MAG TPA: SURF1 family cytochrome oxidase biogenesis protein [Burkholderiaceae bacterium]|nr:SURF1 family cytochrome oxidase biogenesis protein [Burkholderiaceae bacterium]
MPRQAAEVAAQAYRRIVVEGRWLPQQTLYLDNRTEHGVAGFVVVTPLLLGPGDAVLVQRGWAPRDRAARTPAARSLRWPPPPRARPARTQGDPSSERANVCAAISCPHESADRGGAAGDRGHARQRGRGDAEAARRRQVA